jgi:hypothetical protein
MQSGSGLSRKGFNVSCSTSLPRALTGLQK